MLQFFNLKKSKDSELRLKGHEKWVYDVKASADGEWIFSAGWDKTLRMFSTSTGKCIRKFEGHQGTTWRGILLDNDTLLSISDDKTARLWKVSNGSLLKILHFEDSVWSGVKLDDNRFAVGTISGKIHIFEKDCNELFLHLCTFVAHENGVNDLSVWQNRFATASLDRTAKIWDMDTFECLGVLTGHEDSVRCIAMSDSYIVTGSWDRTIRVYDARNYHLIQIITAHGKYIRNVHLVGPQENLFSSADDGTTRLFNSANGQQLWERQVGAHAISSALLKDGRIATALSSGDIVVYDIPPEVAPCMKPLEIRSIAYSAERGPLHDALLSCISGYSCPIEHCETLIKYETSRVSLEEWCSAHRILVLAVEDGDILKHTQYSGEQSWWYDQLYLAVRDIDLRNHEEYQGVKRCLNEAKDLGLIECMDAVLTALHVTKDLKNTAKTLQRTGILIIERILRMEDRLERLKEAYTRYKNSQRKSQLVGIALQVIPIAGGAMAGALSAGSEIVKGLSVKDVTDYALGVGSVIAESQVKAVGDRILEEAAVTLSPASIENMNIARRERLEEALQFCGLDIDLLQELFIERLEDNISDIISESEGAKRAELFESPSGLIEDLCHSVAFVGDEETFERGNGEGIVIDSSQKRSRDESSCRPRPGKKEKGSFRVRDEKEEAENETSLVVAWRGEVDESIEFSTGQGIRELKQVPLTATNVAHLDQKDIARLWAAYICRFDEREREKFVVLAECLVTALRANEVYGTELFDRRLISVAEILSTVVEGLQKNDIEITIGLRARLKRFILDVGSSKCGSVHDSRECNSE